jgi:hypothetical protein
VLGRGGRDVLHVPIVRTTAGGALWKAWSRVDRS